MSDTTTSTVPPDAGERDPHPAGWPRPLSSYPRPSRVVVLLLVNLLVLSWGIAYLSGRIAEESADAGFRYSMNGAPADVATGGDPETCWLLGLVAEDAGKGSLVSGLALRDGAGDCARAAAQGANGQQLSIP